MNLKRSLLATAMMAAIASDPSNQYMDTATFRPRRRFNPGPSKYELPTFSTGAYKGAEYNKIAKRRRKNKLAKQSRKINRP